MYRTIMKWTMAKALQPKHISIIEKIAKNVCQVHIDSPTPYFRGYMVSFETLYPCSFIKSIFCS